MKAIAIIILILMLCLVSCGHPPDSIPSVTTAETTTFATIATLDEWITLPTTAVPETEITTAETVTTAPPVTKNPITTIAEYVTGSDENRVWIEPSTGDPNAETSKRITDVPIITAPGEYDAAKFSLFTDKSRYENDESANITLKTLSYDGAWFGLDCPLYYFNGIEWIKPKWIIDDGVGEVGVLVTAEGDWGMNYTCDFKKNFGELPAGKYKFEVVGNWEGISGLEPIVVTAEFEIVE